MKTDHRLTCNLTPAAFAAMERCTARRDGNKTDTVHDAIKFLDRIESSKLPFGFMREDGVFVEVWVL